MMVRFALRRQRSSAVRRPGLHGRPGRPHSQPAPRPATPRDAATSVTPPERPRRHVAVHDAHDVRHERGERVGGRQHVRLGRRPGDDRHRYRDRAQLAARDGQASRARRRRRRRRGARPARARASPHPRGAREPDRHARPRAAGERPPPDAPRARRRARASPRGRTRTAAGREHGRRAADPVAQQQVERDQRAEAVADARARRRRASSPSSARRVLGLLGDRRAR